MSGRHRARTCDLFRVKEERANALTGRFNPKPSLTRGFDSWAMMDVSGCFWMAC